MKRDFMKELTYNAYSTRQLFQYLKDAKKEMSKSNYSVLRTGQFFDKAYGLDCTISEMVELGLWVYSADFLRYPEKFQTFKPAW